MCARITLLTWDEVAEVVESLRLGRRPDLVEQNDEALPRAQARVGELAPVIAEHENDLAVNQLSWGIEAPWNRKLVFNTRLESALKGSAMWKEAIASGRCIVPAATFFETHATETDPSPKTGRPVKRAYEFALHDRAPLLLASVQVEGCFSVVTTQPNADVAPVHPRMPLVLRFEEAPLWLEGDLADIAALADRADIRLSRKAETHESTASEQLSLF